MQAVVRAIVHCVFALLVLAAAPVAAAPYAAMVIDARDGKVLHSRNADTRLHPASLTKMMTLYIAFEAVENGEISLDDKVTISRKAASEPPSKLGLRSGQRIAFRYLIRAAAVKSANDAATAIAEAIEGSEAAFARRMNRTAASLGMTRTTFRNAHGLTEQGHLSTARDMTKLGRHLFYDYPEYYNLFSRQSTHAGVKSVNNTNRRLLGAYRGADGIKTGYTRAAGFNLVASAERGQERIIATMFGGRSSAQRAQKVSELLNMGFNRAPTRVAVRKPVRVSPGRPAPALAVASSLRPPARPGSAGAPVMVAALAAGIEDAIAEAVVDDIVRTATPAEQEAETELVARASLPDLDAGVSLRPRARPGAVAENAVARGASDVPEGPEVVARRDLGAGGFGITLGRYGSRHQAERMLLQTALTELTTLDEARRAVVPGAGGFAANFVGMSEDAADLACRRLRARNVACEQIGPS